MKLVAEPRLPQPVARAFFPAIREEESGSVRTQSLIVRVPVLVRKPAMRPKNRRFKTPMLMPPAETPAAVIGCQKPGARRTAGNAAALLPEIIQNSYLFRRGGHAVRSRAFGPVIRECASPG